MFCGQRNWRLNEWSVHFICEQVDRCLYRCAVPSNKGKTWFTFVVHINISFIFADLFPLIVCTKWWGWKWFSFWVSSAFGFIWLTLPFFSFLNPTGDLAVTLVNRLHGHSENILNINHMLWVEAAWQVLCECVCLCVHMSSEIKTQTLKRLSWFWVGSIQSHILMNTSLSFSCSCTLCVWDKLKSTVTFFLFFINAQRWDGKRDNLREILLSLELPHKHTHIVW